MTPYIDSYHTLKTLLRPDFTQINIPGSGSVVTYFNFISSPPPVKPEPIKYTSTLPAGTIALIDNEQITENLKFTYPVFIPGGSASHRRALIILHGLNEKCWTKYLPWAQQLAEGLQRPVILFPISYHMNRSPADWSNPRLMLSLLPATRLRNHRNHSSTFVNLALSLRLSLQPMRFFTSGSQSARDLERLVTSIQNGEHPLFGRGAGVDFFAYSIGAFLAQIMMLTYGDSLLSDSRLFMFCGGAPFSRMNGVSKLIMDEEAFIRLRFFYLRQFDREMRSNGTIAGFVNSQPAAMAFRAMADPAQLSDWRRNQFETMKNRIRAIAFKNDKVIPPAGIAEILSPEQLQVIDYQSPYTHENPFPVNGNRDLTDHCFELVFRQAIAFLK